MHTDFFAAIDNIAGLTIFQSQAAWDNYGADTGAAQRKLAGALRVTDTHAIPTVIAAANKFKVALWPVSGGCNFGYGTALPAQDNSVIVDLSALRKVVLDVEAGIAHIEPGVTQHDLAQAIESSGENFLVPTTGVGPNGNLLGNALDGGYGLTPVADHFAAISEFEGYWADGTPFCHVYREMGCPSLAQSWQAGTGPFWGGLLRQGNFGVVTKATLLLARAPEDCRILIFEWESNEDFERSMSELSRLVEDIPGIGGVIMMNNFRILSTQDDAPLASSLEGEIRRAYLCSEAKKRKIAAWTAVCTLYGSAMAVRGSVKDIRRRLKGCRIWSFSTRQVRALARVSKVMPKSWFPALRRSLNSLINALGTVEGRPITAFLKIAYALDKNDRILDETAHPARDGCGILWYAPLVPLSPKSVIRYQFVMSEVLAAHGFDNLLAVTTRTPRVLSATIPLIFDRNDKKEVARAQKCYRALVAAGLAEGWPPYRIGVDFMDMLGFEKQTYNSMLHAKLKAALDPNNIMSPGRYSGN